MTASLSILPSSLLAQRQPQVSGAVVGIDLGTTNSVAAGVSLAHLTNTLPEIRCFSVAQDTELSSYTGVLVPSVVALDGGTQYIGEGARRLRARSDSRRLKQNKDIFWECKNDMGLRRTYHLAPEGYRSAPEIAGHVLAFIKGCTERLIAGPPVRTVVTVPASFQVAQRADTLKAAKLAGLDLQSGDLLDEPIAAFLDYLRTYPERIAERLQDRSHLLVFDFGGGTCDVAVFDLHPNDTGIDISSRAVSRFHRLGGGDIDRAIVYEALIPQLCVENDLGPHALDYDSKRLYLEPALLSVAEALKLQLCGKISELKAFGRKNEQFDSRTTAQVGPLPPITVAERTYGFSAPRLSAADFAKLLGPFLDRDLLCARETEYCLTNSIFSPLQDALDRAGLDRSVVSFVLMAGGSSLIPQVEEALRDFFSTATFLTYDHPEQLQTTVARGAALHAYTMEAFGKPLFRPVAHDSICVCSDAGAHELVAKGEALAPDSDPGWRIFDGLAIASSNLLRETSLRVELVAGQERRLLFRELWHIPPPVNAGEKLRLEYRFTRNQVFEFRLSLLDQPDARFQGEVENPLTHVVNPQSIRLEIDELEEDFRERRIPQHLQADKMVALGEKYAALGQNEKAISILTRALGAHPGPDVHTLNLLGIYCGRIGDLSRQEKFYREAARVGNDSAPLFNLALAQRNRREYEAALKTIEELERRRVDGPALTLKVTIMDFLKIAEGRDRTLEKSLAAYPIPAAQTEWEFEWYQSAVRLKGDKRLAAAVTEEKERRTKAGVTVVPPGELPTMRMSPANVR